MSPFDGFHRDTAMEAGELSPTSIAGSWYRVVRASAHGLANASMKKPAVAREMNG